VPRQTARGALGRGFDAAYRASDTSEQREVRVVATPIEQSEIEGGEAGLTNGLCELTLEAGSPASLAAFYCEAFGWECLSREPDRIWLGCGERARLGLWSPGPKEFGDEGGRHVHFALSIRPGHLDQLIDRLESRRFAYRGPVEHEGGDRSLYIEDPEGNVVEVWDFFETHPGSEAGVRALESS
jgi:hypothetical protein